MLTPHQRREAIKRRDVDGEEAGAGSPSSAFAFAAVNLGKSGDAGTGHLLM
jgi:hypothetical protein